MGKILNTLKYGDKRTKRTILVLLGLAIAAVLLGALAVLLEKPVLFVLAGAGLLVDILLLFNTSFSGKSIAVPADFAEKADSGERANGRERSRSRRDFEEPEQNPLIQYDAPRLKKLMVAYRVKREHVPILIDFCNAENIQYCPAYLWKDAAQIYILLLEREPRMLKYPISSVKTIRIRVGVPAKPSAEYPALKETSLVGKVFAPYLPKYYKREGAGYQVDIRKNLYSVGEGLWCTPASVANVRKLLSAEPVLEESKINSDAYSPYFREIYVSRILYRDSVITAGEYKAKVQEVLESMAERAVSEEVFQNQLAQLVLGGLVPQEYADYAVTKRTQYEAARTARQK